VPLQSGPLLAAQSKRSEADAALAVAAQKVEQAISNVMCRDLSKRIAAAERAHDEFMAASLVLAPAPDRALTRGQVKSGIWPARARSGFAERAA
jgi:hypothetical protein